ncbi:uncharacterized protein [Oscarella lobularis]|uniref:uncharacterized protein n=1 Tax=Oscarella lobularis TaxID=121494 RepID=UPI0033133449
MLKITLLVSLVAYTTAMVVEPPPEEEKPPAPSCQCNPGQPGLPGQNGFNGRPGERGAKGDKGDPGPQTLEYIDDDCSVPNIGKLRYHQVKDAVQYCNGKEWRTFLMEQNENGLGETKEKPAESCLALSKLSGHQPGVYWIKPSASYPAFKTYCREGGWTLLMKIDGTKQTFNYDSSFWTSTSGFNVDSVEFDTNEAKLASFWTLPFNELLLGLRTGHVIHWITLHKSGQSLKSVLAGGYHATNVGRSAWKSLIPNSSLQPHCNREGFNVDFNRVKVRIGISSNNENDCNSNDSWLGFGGFGTACFGNVAKNACGNIGTCGGDNGDQNIFSVGYIFAR